MRMLCLSLVAAVGCASTDTASPPDPPASQSQAPRNEDFDRAALVGMEWEEAIQIIRANKCRCEFIGQGGQTPAEVESLRLPPEEVYNSSLEIGLIDRKVAWAKRR